MACPGVIALWGSSKVISVWVFNFFTIAVEFLLWYLIFAVTLIGFFGVFPDRKFTEDAITLVFKRSFDVPTSTVLVSWSIEVTNIGSLNPLSKFNPFLCPIVKL